MESSITIPTQPGPEQQDAPLTEDERKLLVRLFSDPTYFPVEFRTWIKNYVETAGIQLPASAIVGGTGKLVNLPPGIILPAGGPLTAPNVLPCDGALKLRSDFPKLFQVIGVTWGSSSANDFRVPDLRDRALYGAGTAVALGATDAQAAGSRGGPRHHHTIGQSTDSDGSHSHDVGGSTDSESSHGHSFSYTGATSRPIIEGTAGGVIVVAEPVTLSGSTSGAGGHDHGVSGGTDTDGSHDHFLSGDTSGGFLADRPSFAGVSYVITADV